MTTTYSSALDKGGKYDVSKLQFTHWASEGSDHGNSLRGYTVPDFFAYEGRWPNVTGVYLGADQEGVEPMFSDHSIALAAE